MDQATLESRNEQRRKRKVERRREARRIEREMIKSTTVPKPLVNSNEKLFERRRRDAERKRKARLPKPKDPRSVEQKAYDRRDRRVTQMRERRALQRKHPHGDQHEQAHAQPKHIEVASRNYRERSVSRRSDSSSSTTSDSNLSSSSLKNISRDLEEGELLRTAAELEMNEPHNANHATEREENHDNELAWIESQFTLPSKVLRTFKVVPRFHSQNLSQFLTMMCDKAADELTNLQSTILSFKVWFSLKILYVKDIDESKEHEHSITTHALPIVFSVHDLPKLLETLKEEILSRNANHIRDGSGVVIKRILSAKFSVSRYRPVGGSGFLELPRMLRNKKTIINVKNKDNRCFAYALLAALYHKEPSIANSARRWRARLYEPYFDLHPELTTLPYPFEPNQAPIVEQLLNVNICIYTNNDDAGKSISTVYNSTEFDKPRTALLFYWTNNAAESKGEQLIAHYAAITSLNSLFRTNYDDHHTKYLCPKCLGGFRNQQNLTQHMTLCRHPNGNIHRFCFPEVGKNTLKFKSLSNLLPAPFVIFGDFEAILQPTDLHQGNYIRKYQTHQAAASAFTVVSTITDVKGVDLGYHVFEGPGCADRMIDKFVKIEAQIVAFLRKNERMIFTAADEVKFITTQLCCICQKAFSMQDAYTPIGQRKVRDHDHINGRFRGAAHSACNIKLFNRCKFPVFYHNGKGYDFHMLIRSLRRHPDRVISPIGQSLEKYMLFRWGKHLVFKDSLLFLVGLSLEKAVELLKLSSADESELERNFENFFNGFRSEFAVKPELKSLLLRKGVFPYDWLNSQQRLKFKRLPRLGAFSNCLTSTKAKVEEWRHARDVWRSFGCRTMKDYMLLYLKTDVLLLADVFQSFRRNCLKVYNLDPCHYVSAPNYAWDVMLYKTGVTIEQVTDPEMFRRIDANIRGGVAVIVRRHARANNPGLGSNYDPSIPTSYIVYLDANNLYGWAMSQCLPLSGYRWMIKSEWEKINWRTQELDQPNGYFVECDLEYPDELHEEHNDFPLAPERMQVHADQLSKTQAHMRETYCLPKQDYPKLIASLQPKMNYMCHYVQLRFFLEQGLKLLKIHTVITFRQSRWLKPYIDMNQKLRANAINDHEKNLYKLLNNAIYGKTVENQKKRSDIRLLCDETKMQRLTEKMHCRGFRIFEHDLAAVDLAKLFPKIDKPFPVGFAVLELSKYLVANFHYNVMKKIFPLNKLKLLFTDTDSLMYWIEDENALTKLYVDNAFRFDLSSFPRDSPFYSPVNNRVLGTFKDETSGELIRFFIGLQAKMYAFMTNSGKEKMTAKGISYAVLKQIFTFRLYEKELFEQTINRQKNRRIASWLHRLFSIEVNKRGLCAFDSKRFLREGGIETFAFGHYRLRSHHESSAIHCEVSDMPLNETIEEDDKWMQDVEIPVDTLEMNAFESDTDSWMQKVHVVGEDENVRIVYDEDEEKIINTVDRLELCVDAVLDAAELFDTPYGPNAIKLATDLFSEPRLLGRLSSERVKAIVDFAAVKIKSSSNEDHGKNRLDLRRLIDCANEIVDWELTLSVHVPVAPFPTSWDEFKINCLTSSCLKDFEKYKP